MAVTDSSKHPSMQDAGFLSDVKTGSQVYKVTIAVPLSHVGSIRADLGLHVNKGNMEKGTRTR